MDIMVEFHSLWRLPMARRISRALQGMNEADAACVRAFLKRMIDRDDPDKVLQIIMKDSDNSTGSAR